MKQRRLILLTLLILSLVSACSPGHLGTNTIAFLRDGQIWTIDPDGANAFTIVSQRPPAISYAWSPDHHLLTFRALDSDFARSNAAKHLSYHPLTDQPGDVPATENTIGVDGGTPITIAFSSPDVSYSGAMWNTNGTRLLFRQTSPLAHTPPLIARWWVSQNDQPGGIAIKSLPNSYSIPSLSYNNQTQDQMAIGISDQGVIVSTIAGTNQRKLQMTPFTGHPLPASLERILWRPGHQATQVLYASASQESKPGTPLTIQLLLRTLNGGTQTLTTCQCQQFVWSPDGTAILYSTDTTYTVSDLLTHDTSTITGNAGSIPYWSPDGRFLLFNGAKNLILFNRITHQESTLLSESATPELETTQQPLVPPQALLQPVANNVWTADSHHFLFMTHSRQFWQGHHLSAGLYTVTIDDAGRPQGGPVLVDNNSHDLQAGWTYQDPNTSFLY